ncbi:hypothetical protein BG004_006146 [Podila humilis]|nr:hypothetical protein BG004_006146 [Podila humilis]
MGFVLSRLLAGLISKKEVRILMVGLDLAGKTTILHKLGLGEVVATLPTIGFNVETVEYKNIYFTSWNVGGPSRARRPLGRQFFQNTKAVIYVVDSNDRDSVDEAHDELKIMLQDEELADAVLLVYANKQDLPNAMDTEELANKLVLHSFPQRKWYIQPTCAVTGDGLQEGLEWLSPVLKSA